MPRALRRPIRIRSSCRGFIVKWTFGTLKFFRLAVWPRSTNDRRAGLREEQSDVRVLSGFQVKLLYTSIFVFCFLFSPASRSHRRGQVAWCSGLQCYTNCGMCMNLERCMCPFSIFCFNSSLPVVVCEARSREGACAQQCRTCDLLLGVLPVEEFWKMDMQGCCIRM